MKKIIVLMMASLLLLTSCGSKHANYDQVMSLRESLLVLEDVQALDISITMTELDGDVQKDQSVIGIKLQDIYNPELMKLIMQISMDGDAMKMYITENKGYMEYLGLKFTVPVEDELLDLDMDIFTDEDINDLIEGIGVIEPKDFEITEEDGVTKFHLKDSYVDYLTKLQGFTDELDSQTDSDSDIEYTSLAFLMKDGQFYGIEISGKVQENDNSEASILVIFNNFNDDVDFDFPDFSTFMSLED